MVEPVFNTPTSMIPDAEHLYAQLLAKISSMMSTYETAPVLIGMHRGGAWVAERLHRDLNLDEPFGTVDISFFRDDFSTAGIRTNIKTTHMPINLDGRAVILCDDILNSGRSVRAALNELSEFGRAARIDVAVLFDRGGRELPIMARFVGGLHEFDSAYKLILERDTSNRFCFRVPLRQPIGEPT